MEAQQPARPPSEQGPEYLTLDLLREVERKVDELARRPTVVATTGNWWDVLPGAPYGGGSWKDVFGLGGGVDQLVLRSMVSAAYPTIRIAYLADRLEFTLATHGGAYVVWQRALFFEPPPRA